MNRLCEVVGKLMFSRFVLSVIFLKKNV